MMHIKTIMMSGAAMFFAAVAMPSLAYAQSTTPVRAGNEQTRQNVIKALATIPAGSILTADDLDITGDITGGFLKQLTNIIGMETRRTLVAGAIINSRDLRPPTLVERNAIVKMAYAKGGLLITTEGRALAKGGKGDTIRVMNLSSKISLFAVVTGPSQVSIK